MKKIPFNSLIKNVTWEDDSQIAVTDSFKCSCGNNKFYPSDETGEQMYMYGDEFSTNYCCTECKTIYELN